MWNEKNIYNNNQTKKIIKSNNYWKYDQNMEGMCNLNNINDILYKLKPLNNIILFLDINVITENEYNYFYEMLIEHRYTSTLINIFENVILINNQLKIQLTNYCMINILDILIKHLDNYIILTDNQELVTKYNNCHIIFDFFKQSLEIYHKRINVKKSFKYDIKPYFIYFPQFHEIPENDINFYEGFTDIKNLYGFNLNNKIDKLCETPNLKELCTTEYNLLDINLLQRQINMLNEFGFPGFAMYYYWFSENTITKKNTIFEKVIDKFFNDIDMKDIKIFFIWANENWTDTIALSNINNKHKIINNYNEDDFKNNINNLMKYFIKDCYLKINNKPVLFIYHSWKMTIDQINLFNNMLHNKCLEYGFDGIYLVLNSMFNNEETKNIYNDYKQFYMNLNYKNEKISFRTYSHNKSSFILDYNLYTNSGLHIKNEQINTIFYNFDNHPRFFNPDKTKYATLCINNTEFAKYMFTKNIIETYVSKTEEIDKILLINAWNEWGENMAFEPSNETGYYNINLLLKAFVDNYTDRTV
jgi:hypothetical protein